MSLIQLNHILSRDIYSCTPDYNHCLEGKGSGKVSSWLGQYNLGRNTDHTASILSDMTFPLTYMVGTMRH